MLRSNSKAVKEKIKQYIIDGFGYEDFEVDTSTSYKALCSLINEDFERVYSYRKGNRQDCFVDWCCGLPSILNTCYVYNVSAVDLLGDWLEETEEEKSRFDERQAEEMISKLLYREIMANCN